MHTDSSPSRLDARRHAQDTSSVGLMLGFAGTTVAVFLLILALVCAAFFFFVYYVL